jgi:hypothetical protein
MGNGYNGYFTMDSMAIVDNSFYKMSIHGAMMKTCIKCELPIGLGVRNCSYCKVRQPLTFAEIQRQGEKIRWHYKKHTQAKTQTS